MHFESLISGAFVSAIVCAIVIHELLKSCKRIIVLKVEENNRLREEIACYRWRESQSHEMLDRVGVRRIDRN